MLSILVLSAAVAFARGLAVEKVCKSNHSEFDHYTFTEEYPAGVCYSQYCSQCSYPPNASLWTIHGLWPTCGLSKTKPTNCQGKHAKFDPNAIKSLIPLLRTNWTDICHKVSAADYYLWSHEYVKHGTCSGMKEYNYFKKGLDLFDSFGSFGDVLRKGNIVPSNQTIYDADDIRSVLGSAYHVMPTIQCSTAKRNTQTQQTPVLIQIQLCLTKDDFTPMECPDRKETDSCPDQVFYPPSIYSQN